MRLLIALFFTFIFSFAHAQNSPQDQQRYQMRKDMIRYVRANLDIMLLGYANYAADNSIEMDKNLALVWQEHSDIFRGMVFRYISDSEFKTHDININRLAINTGQEILLNADRLAVMPELSIYDVTQLLLHEFNHLVIDVAGKRLTTAEKDKMVARFVDYLRAKTWSARNQKFQYSILELDINYLRVPLRLAEEQRRFLAWFTTDSSFQPDEYLPEKVYAIESPEFPRRILRAAKANVRCTNCQLVPIAEIYEVRTNPQGEIAVRIKYSETLLSADRASVLEVDHPMVYSRIITMKDPSTFDSTSSYRELEMELSFEIVSVKEADGKAIVRLKIVGENQARANDLLRLRKGSIAVLAKDKSGNRFSFQLQRIGNTNEGEIVLPQIRDLSLTEMLFQARANDLVYFEPSIRPSQPQNLRFSSQAQSREKLFETRSVVQPAGGNRILIDLPYDLKDIRSATFEIDTYYNVRHQYGDISYPQARGLKIYLSSDQLLAYRFGSSDAINIPIPDVEPGADPVRLEDPNSRRPGQGIRVVDHRGLYGLKGAWLHMSNGQNIKLEFTPLPAAAPKPPNRTSAPAGPISCKKVYGSVR